MPTHLLRRSRRTLWPVNSVMVRGGAATRYWIAESCEATASTALFVWEDGMLLHMETDADSVSPCLWLDCSIGYRPGVPVLTGLWTDQYSYWSRPKTEDISVLEVPVPNFFCSIQKKSEPEAFFFFSLSISKLNINLGKH